MPIAAVSAIIPDPATPAALAAVPARGKSAFAQLLDATTVAQGGGGLAAFPTGVMTALTAAKKTAVDATDPLLALMAASLVQPQPMPSVISGATDGAVRSAAQAIDPATLNTATARQLAALQGSAVSGGAADAATPTAPALPALTPGNAAAAVQPGSASPAILSAGASQPAAPSTSVAVTVAASATTGRTATNLAAANQSVDQAAAAPPPASAGNAAAPVSTNATTPPADTTADLKAGLVITLAPTVQLEQPHGATPAPPRNATGKSAAAAAQAGQVPAGTVVAAASTNVQSGKFEQAVTAAAQPSGQHAEAADTAPTAAPAATHTDPSLSGVQLAATAQVAPPSNPAVNPLQANPNAGVPLNPAAEQVVVAVKRAVSAGEDKISIELRPANLGTVEVKLSLGHDGSVAAVVTADRPDTLKMLSNDAHGLEQALRDAGLRADSGSLSFNLRGGDPQSNQQAFQGNTSSGSRSNTQTPAAVDAFAGTTAGPVQSRHVGALDISI